MKKRKWEKNKLEEDKIENIEKDISEIDWSKGEKSNYLKKFE